MNQQPLVVKLTGSTNSVGMPFEAAMQGSMGDWVAIFETPEPEDDEPQTRVRFWNREGFRGVATWLITVVVVLVAVQL